MSRSNPTESARSPSSRWFEFASGADGGFVRYYDKNQEKNITLEGKFTFILLDELATVKGWHDPSASSIYANEVRDTRQDALVVKSFKGGELASGLYASIKDRIVALGGHFVASCYIAYKHEEGDLRIGNIRFKGGALGVWMDFKKQCPTKKDSAGKSMKAYYVDAVKIDGYEQQKKGATVYRVPKFALQPLSGDTNNQAIALDGELQSYLTDYLKRPRAEAATAAAPEQKNGFEDVPDDLPWKDDVPTKNVDDDDSIPF